MGYGVTGVVNIPVGDTLRLARERLLPLRRRLHRLDRQQPDPEPQEPDVNIVDGTPVEDDLNGSETSGGRVSRPVHSRRTTSPST